MRVLVSGGGTAGHINPALAIADAIKAAYPDAVVEYVGTPNGMENRLVPKAGYRMHTVAVRGFKRKLTIQNVDAAVKAVTSVVKAGKIIKDFAPDLVIGTGGYVSWPVVRAAAKKHIPTLIHEQNAFPGVTTKMLSRYADRVMISFDESRPYFDCDGEKLILVGNPVSEKMLHADKQAAREKLGISPDKTVILSAGGSLGARRLNEAVFEVIRDYSVKRDEIVHFHATGKGGYGVQSALYRGIGFEDTDEETVEKNGVTVSAYIYNMPDLLAAADVVICRAGAMTLSEIAVMGKAAVIVPSPNVTNDHQYKNAKVLADADAGLLLKEADLTGESLLCEVKKLADDAAYREKVERNVKAFAHTDTLEKIMACVREALGKGKART